MRPGSGRDRRGEWLTVVWIAGWAVLLWKLHRPWWALGGWIDSRAFWVERAALYFAPPLGYAFGAWRRRRRLTGHGGASSGPVRSALLALTILVLSSLAGSAEVVGAATTAICGFAAGRLTASWRLLLRDDCRDPPAIPHASRRAARKERRG